VPEALKKAAKPNDRPVDTRTRGRRPKKLSSRQKKRGWGEKRKTLERDLASKYCRPKEKKDASLRGETNHVTAAARRKEDR